MAASPDETNPLIEFSSAETKATASTSNEVFSGTGTSSSAGGIISFPKPINTTNESIIESESNGKRLWIGNLDPKLTE